MLRRIGRATAFLSFASKLLVPVGYMPAALGDGGPIRLCDSGLAGALLDASVHADAGALHDSLHGHPVAASDSLHGHAGAARNAPHGHAVAGDGQADYAHHPAQDPARHGHDTQDHGPWERCALGGLASLAAIASEPILPIDSAPVPERIHAEIAAWPSRAEVAVRARGPPST